MTTQPEVILAEFLWRAGTFLILAAWIIGSTWFMVVIGSDIYSRWGSWHTYPIPDKRAIKHIVAFLALIGGNLLFLWFAVQWFLVSP